MGDIRRTLIIKGFDELSADIYMSSWAKGTLKQYNVYLKHWTEYCVVFRVHPRSPKLIEVMKFLTWLSKVKKLSYSAVNSARSALSSYVKRFGVFTVGAHPEVTRHIKGIHRTNPPKAKLRVTWEVNTVFRMLKQWEPLEDLSFKKLTFKTLMLLALVTAQRIQGLFKMKLSGLVWLDERVLVTMDELLKHTRCGQALDVFSISKFNKDRRLCPVRALKRYIKVTKKCRKGEDKVWISLSKPRKAVTKETLARWIRLTLAEAGINQKVYTAHSTRGASTSKAKVCGVAIEAIMKKARWTNATTFAKFYDKEIDEEHVFQNALLTNAAKES